MEFKNVLMPIISGKSNNLQDALGRTGFTEYGVKIPIAYGLSITIYAPPKAFEWCKNEVDQFMIDKMLHMGGAMPFLLEWMDFDLAHGVMYFNAEIGIAVVLEPDIGELDRAYKGGLNSGDPLSSVFGFLRSNQDQKLHTMYGNNVDFKEFYKMQEVLNDVVLNQFGITLAFILWPDLEGFFNNWYYTGMMRRGLIFKPSKNGRRR